MMKIIIFFLLTYTLQLFADPLPNWIDPIRENIKNSDDPFKSYEFKRPPKNFRVPPEYGPMEAVVLGYKGYYEILEKVAQLTVKFGHAQVWAGAGPLKLPGVPGRSYISVPCQLDSAWMRDYGPVGIVEEENKLALVDTIYRHYRYRIFDDQFPSCLARERAIKKYDFDLVLDGGNFMVDSFGNLFMTKRTYIWNAKYSEGEVDQKLKDYFNVHTVHALDYAGYPSAPFDGTGHIDMFVKLLNDDTVLIAKSESKDFGEALEKAVDYFRRIRPPRGQKYKIIRVKGWSEEKTWFTYTNSLIVNQLVIIPSYKGHERENKLAIEAYQRAMPGYLVKAVASDASITSGGSLHCLTQLIPKISRRWPL